MTKAVEGSEPSGISGDCFYVLGMYDDGPGLTALELHRLIARENESLGWPGPTLVQVQGALPNTLAKRGLVERRAGHRWSHSAYGRRMLAVWCGEDPEPARVPCGLGWPG